MLKCVHRLGLQDHSRPWSKTHLKFSRVSRFFHWIGLMIWGNSASVLQEKLVRRLFGLLSSRTFKPLDQRKKSLKVPAWFTRVLLWNLKPEYCQIIKRCLPCFIFWQSAYRWYISKNTIQSKSVIFLSNPAKHN